MDKNTQQSVSYIPALIALADRIEHMDEKPMCISRDAARAIRTAITSSLPRDVLMALAKSVESELIAGGYVALTESQLSTVVDRYASKVQPEPVNQQMLAALKEARQFLTMDRPINPLEIIDAAIAADEAAQPVVYDRALIVEMLNRYCECVDARTHDSGKVIEQMDLLARATQQPVSAKPVAVQDGVARATEAAAAAIYFADSSDYLSALWDILRFLSPDIAALAESDTRSAWERAEQARSQLSAAQKQEGGVK